MLDQVDELIRTVLRRDIPGLTDADQVRFQPPDEDWWTVGAVIVDSTVAPSSAVSSFPKSDKTR